MPIQIVSSQDFEKQVKLAKLTMQAYWNVGQRAFRFQAPLPEFRLTRINRICGRAIYVRNVIAPSVMVLNPDFLKDEPVAAINNTIPHEISHIIAGMLYGSAGHDTRWYQVMKIFGLNASPRSYRNYESPVHDR